MLKTLQVTLVLLAGGFFFTDLTPALADSADFRLISPELLKHAGLQLVWEKKLPMRKSEKLSKLYFLAGHLYALSDHNYMTCLDRPDGRIIFAKSLAPKGVPIAKMMPYGHQLLSAYTNRVVVFDPLVGDVVETKSVPYKIACPPARNDEYLYIGGVDNRLHVFHADNYVKIFDIAPDNNSRVNSILAGDSSVIFTTDRGNIISMLPDRPRRLWQFDAAGSIIGPLVREDDSLFFASDDTNVYRVDVLNLSSRRLAWKHQMPGLPIDGPKVTDSVVYQVVRGKGVLAIDRQRGTELWILPHGAEFLAEHAGRAYVMTHDKTIAVMDNSSGNRLYEFNCNAVSRFAPNPADPMIYVGSDSGWLMCLRPEP